MDELLTEFLTETTESLDVVDVELVKFEQDPNNAQILDNIFRLVHTIKGTCGFLGLPRLEALAHSAETLMGQFRDGIPVTPDAVSLILASLDRIKELLATLEDNSLRPVADADRHTWLRRVTFDLTGLPPTVEEIHAFFLQSRSSLFRYSIDRSCKLRHNPFTLLWRSR